MTTADTLPDPSSHVTLPATDAAMLFAAASLLNAWFAGLATPDSKSPAGLIGAMHDAGMLAIETSAEGGRQTLTQTPEFLEAIVRTGQMLEPMLGDDEAPAEATAA